jgi:hypothetical protein
MIDPDIDRWTADWKAGAPPAIDVVRMARRERRWLWTWIALDWAVGAVFIALAIWIWFNDSSPGMRFVAVAIVVLVAAALAFTMRNWRGTLAGDRASTVEFLELSMHRCKARQRYVRFGWLLLVGNVIVITIAFSLDIAKGQRELLPGMILLTCLVTATAAGILWLWGRRERRREERLVAMRRALQENETNGRG